MGIRASNVTKSFGGPPAVDDLSIDMATGSLVALLGPSGCGKSTLLRMIAGLDHPDQGAIYINGEEVTRRSVQERQVGFVFQHFALFKHRTVRQNIAFGLELRHWSPNKVHNRVEELLSLVQERSLPVVLRRLVHLGREVVAEVVTEGGQVISAQLPREQVADRIANLSQGSRLHIRPRAVRLWPPAPGDGPRGPQERRR
jgi:ABC-type ATPase involved in cell division